MLFKVRYEITGQIYKVYSAHKVEGCLKTYFLIWEEKCQGWKWISAEKTILVEE